MKKGIIVVTALVGIVGGVTLSQSTLFGSAQNEEFLTASAAKKIALQQFTGTVIDYDFDRDDITPHYEFEIKNDTEKVEVEVDAVNGEATITERKSVTNQTALKKAEDKVEDQLDKVEAEAEITRDTARQQVANKVQQPIEKTEASSHSEQQAQNIIAKSQAISIAQAKASGTVTKAKLDNDDSIQVYEIEIRNGKTEHDFEIHAATGQILEYDTDYDEENDND